MTACKIFRCSEKSWHFLQLQVDKSDSLQNISLQRKKSDIFTTPIVRQKCQLAAMHRICLCSTDLAKVCIIFRCSENVDILSLSIYIYIYIYHCNTVTRVPYHLCMAVFSYWKQNNWLFYMNNFKTHIDAKVLDNLFVLSLFFSFQSFCNFGHYQIVVLVRAQLSTIHSCCWCTGFPEIWVSERYFSFP